MCGIFGYVSVARHSDTFAREKFLKSMCFMDTLRGEDGTGGFKIADGDKIEYARDAVDGPTFYNNNSIFDLKGGAKCVVGHNRQSTKGADIPDNCHPFWVRATDGDKGEVIGVHNGTLTKTPAHCGHDVDSYNMYFSIANMGAKKALPKAQGAMTLVWFDAQTKLFHITRNHQRPLFAAFAPDGKTMYFASEDGMLRAALGRAKLPIRDNQVFDVDTNVLYSFDMNTQAALPLTWTTEAWKSSWATPAYSPRDARNYSGYPDYRPADSSKRQAVAAVIDGNKAKPLTKKEKRALKNQKRAENRDPMKRFSLKKEDIYMGEVRSWEAYDTDQLAEWGSMFVAMDLPMWEHGEKVTETVELEIHGVPLAAYEAWRPELLPFHVYSLTHAPDGKGFEGQAGCLKQDAWDNFCKDRGDEFEEIACAYLRTLEYYIDEQAKREKDMSAIDTDVDSDPIEEVMVDGKPMSLLDYAALIKYGCSDCQKNLDTTDSKELEWRGELKNSPVCKECQDKDLDAGAISATIH